MHPTSPLKETASISVTSTCDESERKRSSSFEKWLQKTLRMDPSKKNERKELEKLARRHRRQALVRKLFGREAKDPVNEEEEDSMVSNEDVYKATLVENTLDTEEDDSFDDNEDEDEEELLEASLYSEDNTVFSLSELVEDEEDESEDEEDDWYVIPPVSVPPEYVMQDRRGGTIVAGRYVLFTNAVFKRKQRQFMYTMRSIHENQPYLVRDPSISNRTCGWV